MWFSELPGGSVVVASGVDSIVVNSMLLDSVVEVSIDVGSLVVDSMDSMVVVSMDSIVEDSMVVVDSISFMVEVLFVVANVVVLVDNAGLVAVAVTGFSGTFFSSSILNTTLNTSPKFSNTCSIVFFAISVQVSNENASI